MPRGGRLAAPIVVGLAFLLLTWPVILLQAEGTSEAYDQREYHEPVIRAMAGEWPEVDLIHYESATTPGYHLFMAAMASVVSERSLVLQLLSSVFGLGFLLAVHRTASREVGPWPATALVMPLLGSSYVLGGSIWLTTDNAGKLFAALAVGGAAMLTPTAGRIARWGLYATAGVLVRQILLWAAAPVAFAAILASPLGRLLPPVIQFSEAAAHRRRTLLLALPLVIAPFAVVGAFFWLWHGMVPPNYVDQHASGANPAVMPLAISLMGGYGMFFLPVIGGPGVRRLIADPLLWIAAAGALALSLAFATTFDRDAGRWGGVLWFAASKLPAIGGRNLLFPPLSVLAAVVLVCAWRRACAAGHGRGAAILLLSMLGWLAAQVLNSQAWQRYCEPIVLLELIWLAALAAGPGTGSAGGQPGGAGRIRGSAGGHPGRHGPAHLHGPARWIGPVLLGLLLLGISAYTLYYGVYVDLTGRQS